MGKKFYIVTLTAEERTELRESISKGRAAAHKLLHARILLKADAGPQGPAWIDAAISQALEVSQRTVERVRKRFVQEGIEAALNRKPQTNLHSLKVDGEVEASLVALACSPPPKGRQRWTLHLLADRLVELRLVDKLSYETVRRTLKKTNSSLG